MKDSLEDKFLKSIYKQIEDHLKESSPRVLEFFIGEEGLKLINKYEDPYHIEHKHSFGLVVTDITEEE